jgi:hypothetical protein
MIDVDGQKRQTVTVTPTVTITSSSDNFDDEIDTANWSALSSWYKIDNAPIYKQYW